ncbi:MAG: hypothetical protein GEU79_02180 [Acidimicrobiia bacterium]|nr:hypothetical protein [Acidimicrobiia bacterium]
MTDPVIIDRGYRRYDGPRLGPRSAEWAIFREGVRRVLGLGQKARRKILPWALLAIAVTAAAVFVGLHFFVGETVGSGFGTDELPSYGQLFDFYSWIGLIFIALAAPTLLIPDRIKGVLSVYFSRPLTVNGYLRAKAGAFLGVTALIYLVPQLVLHLGLAFLSDGGFLGYLWDEIAILWQVPVVALGYLAIHGSIATLVASLVKRVGAAAAVFFAIIAAVGPFFAGLATLDFPGAGWLSLLHFDHHPRVVRDWIFDIDSGDFAMEVAGFDPWISAVVIAVITVLCSAVVLWRYRREA